MTSRNIACLAGASFVASIMIGATISTPAHGQSLTHQTVTGHRTDTRRVPFGDLALNTKQGRRTLYHRVGQAVREVCPDWDPQLGAYDVIYCKDTAWDSALPQIHRAFDRAAAGLPMAMSIEVVAAR